MESVWFVFSSECFSILVSYQNSRVKIALIIVHNQCNMFYTLLNIWVKFSFQKVRVPKLLFHFYVINSWAIFHHNKRERPLTDWIAVLIINPTVETVFFVPIQEKRTIIWLKKYLLWCTNLKENPCLKESQEIHMKEWLKLFLYKKKMFEITAEEILGKHFRSNFLTEFQWKSVLNFLKKFLAFWRSFETRLWESVKKFQLLRGFCNALLKNFLFWFL